MKIYLVGGAVRDKLLGLPIKERDWVVVGATVSDMMNLGYRQVGKDFPVFLHPKTNEEYALARLERKIRPGYQGFSFDTSPIVTLEDDLLRRDLTINAMAETQEGQLIDPYHGKNDLETKLLRHVSAAFAEDPVRILRVGRFYARFADKGFTIADETIALMRQMVLSGEVNALVAERVWKELERALSEKHPERFFQALSSCGALSVLFPDITVDGPGMQAFVEAAPLSDSPLVRFAALLYPLPLQAITTLCQRYRAPNAYRELAQLTAKHQLAALHAKKASAHELLTLYSALDIFRREDRFHDFLQACLAIAKATKHRFDPPYLVEGARIAKSVDVQTLIAKGFEGATLAVKLKEARVEQLAEWLEKQ